MTITAGAVAGFLPSTAGFHFANRWPAGPALRFEVRVPGPVPVGVALAIGEVANGLCGGMALAAIDRFVRGEGPPPDREPPAPGTPLFGEIVRRQVDSLELGLAVARFYRASAVGDAVRARIAVRDAWPGVRRAVDGGRPAAVGLIHAASADPRRLIGNHQVVAYGYELEASAGRVSLAIYDPNHPDDDAIHLRIALAGPRGPVTFGYVPGETPVLGLVRLRDVVRLRDTTPGA